MIYKHSRILLVLAAFFAFACGCARQEGTRTADDVQLTLEMEQIQREAEIQSEISERNLVPRFPRISVLPPLIGEEDQCIIMEITSLRAPPLFHINFRLYIYFEWESSELGELENEIREIIRFYRVSPATMFRIGEVIGTRDLDVVRRRLMNLATLLSSEGIQMNIVPTQEQEPEPEQDQDDDDDDDGNNINYGGGRFSSILSAIF